MSTISTHVLDTARGMAAESVMIYLARQNGEEWLELSSARTDADGRVKNLLPDNKPIPAGLFRLRFETGPYFTALGRDTFYPYADIVFQIPDGNAHYHVPLLISGWGYSTYRGS